MHKKIALVFAIICGIAVMPNALLMSAQKNILKIRNLEIKNLAPTLPILEPEVTFLAKPPVIDGILDKELDHLPARTFSILAKTNRKTPDIHTSYRIAYGADFLYLYLEIADNHLIFRDHAYQNGDGFHLVFAVPHEHNEGSDEYYLLGFSANDIPENAFRKFIWYYNRERIHRTLSDKTLFEIQHSDSKTGFELLLPWSEVHPYHPWFSESIGFNLCFVKAIGDDDINYYFIIPDDIIHSEQNPRLYSRLKFQEPQLKEGLQTVLMMQRNNILAGESAKATMVTLASSKLKEFIQSCIVTGEGEQTESYTFELPCKQGLNRKILNLDIAALPPDGYELQWKSKINGSAGQSSFTILPAFNVVHLREQLGNVRDKILKNNYATLQFMLDQIEKTYRQLKPYETGGLLRLHIYEFDKILEDASKGTDDLAMKTGRFRRAFRSIIDDTLQPYTIRIPPDFDKNKKYALLVFLHGRGEDDNEKLAKLRMPDGLIAIAPRARSTSNYYVKDDAQKDIQEALADVLSIYPIDSERIILGGFSMGGYGVYRTFYENPEKFNALVILSGHPNLANLRLSKKEEYPDFLKKNFLQLFHNIPIFIAHGAEDRNVPIEPTQQLVTQLQASGAMVEFHIDANTGHDTSKETWNLLYEWLERFINEKPKRQGD